MQKGSKNMNKIFKVIWSKTRNCYVVASELAKGRTKAASTGDKAKRLALAAITALMLLPVGGYSYAADAADTTKVEPASGTSTATVEVYTKAGADDTFVKKGSDNGDSLTIGASKSETYSTHQYVTGAQTTYDGLNGKVVTQATGGESSISLKVGNSGDLTYNFQNYSEVTTTKDKGTTFTYYYEDGAQTIDNNTTIKGNTVTTGSVTASNGVVDETTTEGVSVKKTNTVGQNLNALDQAMKDEKTSTALHISSSGDLIVGTKENQTVKDMEIRGKLTSGSLSTGNITATGDVTVTGKMAADGVTDETTKDGTYIKQNNTVGNNLVSLNTQVKANADAINEEAQKRKYSVTNLEKADAAEAATREAKDNELNERITNEANAIHDEIKAGDEKLDTRITNVKEYLEKQTSDTYVSKDDAAVQDGAIVKADKTIGENVTNLDAALAKETADRLGADKAQDKVIEQVNQNMVDGFNTINKNMADGFTALNQADANELAGRMAADTKLVEAVNSGLSLSNDNVLQKNTTTIDAQGNVTTSKTDANEMILNKGKDNQITLNKNGIKVGTNSTVVDKDGVYTGGDTYSEAKAAMSADGKIKGANGAFTVDENGNVTSKATITGETVTDGKGASMSNGTVTGKTLTDGIATISNGNIKTNGGFIQTGGGNINTQGGALRTNGGNINAGSGTITGNKLTDGVASLQNGNLTTTGNASVGGTLSSNGLTNTGNATTDTLKVNHNATVGGNLAVTGDITGKSLNVGTGAISGGQITGTGLDVGAGTIKTTGATETGTLKTTGKAEIGGDMTVTGNTEMKGNLDVKGNLSVEGEFNAKTLSSKLDENNYTTINGGKTQSMNLKMDAATGETKASASTFDENGSNTWAKDDDSIGKSTVTADSISQKLSNTGDNPTAYAESTMSQGTGNKYTMTDTVKDGDKTNVAFQSATESSDVVTDANGNTSTFRQRVDAILQEINNADGDTLTKVEQTDTAITSQIGDGSAIKSVMNADGIANTATGKSITNDAADIINTGTNSVTNQVGSNKVVVDTTGVKSAYGDNTYTTWNAEGITNSTDGNMTNTVGGEMKTTVTGKVTEDYKSDLDTKVGGNETHYVAGSQTNIVAGNQQNTVSGSKT